MSHDNGVAAHPEILENTRHGLEAIRQDYPRLVRDYLDHIVIYNGPRLVAVVRTAEEMDVRCHELGLTSKDIVYAYITEHTLDDLFGECHIA